MDGPSFPLTAHVVGGRQLSLQAWPGSLQRTESLVQVFTLMEVKQEQLGQLVEAVLDLYTTASQYIYFT